MPICTRLPPSAEIKTRDDGGEQPLPSGGRPEAMAKPWPAAARRPGDRQARAEVLYEAGAVVTAQRVNNVDGRTTSGAARAMAIPLFSSAAPRSTPRIVLYKFCSSWRLSCLAWRPIRPVIAPRIRAHADACSCRTCTRSRVRRCRACSVPDRWARGGAGQLLEAGRVDEARWCAPGASTRRYSWWCIAGLSACEISPVSTEAPSTSRLMSVLLPAR